MLEINDDVYQNVDVELGVMHMLSQIMVYGASTLQPEERVRIAQWFKMKWGDLETEP